MNHYPHHIGDFRSGTVNMSRLERWIYRDLLDVYYDTERPLVLDVDKLCREIGARETGERAAVVEVLDYKFTKTEGGYVHARCDEEIAIYRAKAETAKENGKKGGRPKKAEAKLPEPDDNPEKPSGLVVGSENNQPATGSKTNQEPVTNNQVNNPPYPPEGGDPESSKKKATIEFKTFLENCKANGEKPISQNDPVFEYAAEAGISNEWLHLAWFEFKARMAERKKRHTDWRQVFRNYVRGNYLKLWGIREDGTSYLTTQGMQAKQVFDSRMAR